jgi:thiamine-phosphate pyrophosphorylase
MKLGRLYAVADASFGDPVQLADRLFTGGARMVQVRNKKGSSREVFQQVERILSFAPRDAVVIVNDRIDIALIAGAAGVHVGQTDLPPVEARRALGADRIVGVSTHSLEQACVADRLPVDYVAFGPIFPTRTKENPDAVVGVEGLAAVCRSVAKPVVAIGGIQLQNAAEILNAGAAAVAVIRDILESTDITARVKSWLEALKTV